MSNEIAVREKQMMTVNEILKEFKSMDANIVGNETYITAPPPVGFVNSYEVVNINPDPRYKEVYPQRGGGLSLTAVGLKKLGKAMGIKFGPGQIVSRTTDEKGNLVSIIFRSVACVRGLDGQYSWSMMDYEFDVTKREKEIRNNLRKDVRYFQSGAQGARDKAPPSFKVCKTSEQVEAWIDEQTRVEMIQIEKNALTRAQTGSQLRCIRDLGAFPSTYLPEQLEKPFLVPKLVVYFEAENPIDRAFALEQTKVPMMMFPQAEAPKPIEEKPAIWTPQMQAIEAQRTEPKEIRTDRKIPDAVLARKEVSLPSEEEVVEIENIMEPQLTPHEMPVDPEMQLSVYESNLMDFEACDADDQVMCLEQLMKRKHWKGNLTKALPEFTKNERLGFFQKLFAIPDPEDSKQSTLPWGD